MRGSRPISPVWGSKPGKKDRIGNGAVNEVYYTPPAPAAKGSKARAGDADDAAALQPKTRPDITQKGREMIGEMRRWISPVKLARREMDDAMFHRDRLREAASKLAERVEALKALEADRRLRAEHERVSAERDRLAEEMQRMVEPIVRIAHLVRAIEFCDRENGRLNATSELRHGCRAAAAARAAADATDACQRAP